MLGPHQNINVRPEDDTAQQPGGGVTQVLEYNATVALWALQRVSLLFVLQRVVFTCGLARGYCVSAADNKGGSGPHLIHAWNKMSSVL